METINGLFLKARALLNQYTEDGLLIPETELIDMKMKTIPLADMVQKEIYKYARVDLTKDSPNTITSIDDTTEVNELGNLAMVNFIASRLAPFSNKELVNFFLDEYKELKRELIRTSPAIIYEPNGGDE